MLLRTARDEKLLRESVEASNQSRAREQADSEPVIGLPCPLPEELSKIQKMPILSAVNCRKQKTVILQKPII